MKLGPQRNYHEGRAALRHYANQPAHPLLLLPINRQQLYSVFPGGGDTGTQIHYPCLMRLERMNRNSVHSGWGMSGPSQLSYKTFLVKVN